MAVKKKVEQVEVKKEEPQIAISIQRKAGDWIVKTYTIEGDKIVSVVEGKPNSKAVILHEFKVAAADTFWTDK